MSEMESRTERQMSDLLASVGPLDAWSIPALDALEQWMAQASVDVGRVRTSRAGDVMEDQLAEVNHFSVLTCLRRVLASPSFSACRDQQKFLSYLVEKTLVGDGKRLKGYSIGVEVFGRPHHFHPNQDAVVRVKAKRLRDKLSDYYQNVGKADEVHFYLPKGSYQINFNASAQRL